jgi:hypothetical protein
VTEAAPVALGCAAHSGWAAVVGCGHEEGRPRILLRERVEMMDPRDPASKQPYHAVESLSLNEAARLLAGWTAAAERMAAEGLRGMIQRLAARDTRCVGVGILESSGRKGESLARIVASHSLIHTADGDHYRDALARAAKQMGLPVVRLPARDLEARTAEAWARPGASIRKARRFSRGSCSTLREPERASARGASPRPGPSARPP